MPKVNLTNADAFSLLDFSYEQSLLGQYKAIVGIDEVGRGPLAGPVTAAAVDKLVVVRLGRLFRLAKPFGGFCDQRYPVGFPLSVRFPVEREEF